MGYRIEYGEVGIYKHRKPMNWGKLVAFLCVLILVAGAITVKTVSLPWVQEVLLPGDPEVTAAALEGLVEDLQQGDSLGQAIRAFCEEIMANGDFPE